MIYTVIIEERSRFSRDGLMYDGVDGLAPGTLVEVPLQKRIVTGVVIASHHEKPAGISCKSIVRVLRQSPILSHAHLQTMLWMSEYYCCSLRSCIQPFIGITPWKRLANDTEIFVKLGDVSKMPRGTKQRAIIAYLQGHGDTEEQLLLEATHASRSTLNSLIKEQKVQSTEKQKIEQIIYTKTDDSRRNAASPQPLLSMTTRGIDERMRAWMKQAIEHRENHRSSLILFPTVYDAEQAFDCVEKESPERAILITSDTSTATKAHLMKRALSGEAMIIIGTRQALFFPVRSLGMIVLDHEHEWGWKSIETPRYHARLTAEVLAKTSGAELILHSATPSLDSLKHARVVDGSEGRYRWQPEEKKTLNTHCSVIDLASAEFGQSYPFTKPLIDAITTRIDQHEGVVLFLNRRGTGSSMLCLDCRQSITGKQSIIPYSVVTRNSREWLLDRETGEMIETPLSCPRCDSSALKSVGAGTERIEQLCRERWPHATIVRADGETLTKAGAMKGFVKNLEHGTIDILLGTTPVLHALKVPRVTLAGILVADVGLSVPDFRAGERVFELIAETVERMRPHGQVIIQTFRPDAPEIKSVVDGDPLQYLAQELDLRLAMHYPPAVPMMDLIIRDDGARARSLYAMLQEQAKVYDIAAKMREEHSDKHFTWTINLRGKRVREFIHKLPLGSTIINVDPVEG